MNFLKQWWVWFLVIFLVLIVVYRLLSDDPFLQYTINFLIFGLPIFTFLGLVLNIKKNKMKFATDWVFWVWLILFLLSLINVYTGIFSSVSSKVLGSFLGFNFSKFFLTIYLEKVNQR